MRLKKIPFLVFFLFVLTACSASSMSDSTEQGKEDKDFSVELSEDEMEQEHLELELAENIMVDAEITPYHLYKDGLNSYFTDYYKDIEDVYDKEEIREKYTIYGKDCDTMIELLKKQIDADFSYSTEDIVISDQATDGSIDLGLYMENQADSDYELCYLNWWNGSDAIYNPQLGYRRIEENFHNIAMNISTYVASYDTQSLDIGAGKQTEEALREWLEEITGETISEKYDIVVLSQENYDEYLKAQGNTNSETVEEAYVYYFYRDVDGFPWKGYYYSMDLTDDMELSEFVSRQVKGSFVLGHPDYAEMVAYTEEGIAEVETQLFNEISDVYQKKEAVADINTILLNTQSYYESQLNLSTISVYEIELCYASGFSKQQDGEIRNIVQPFWIVKCWDEDQKKRYALQFDGYSGNFIQETGVIW